MTRLNYYADFIIAPLVVLLMVVLVLFSRSPMAVAAWFGTGVIAWTFVEYWLHRSAHIFKCLRDDHQFHHDHPVEFSGPSSLAVMGLYAGSLMFPHPLVAGMIAGYAAFVWTHHAVHRMTIGPQSWLYGLKMRHVAHHRGEEANFGVITSFWDRVFRTERQS